MPTHFFMLCSLLKQEASTPTFPVRQNTTLIMRDAYMNTSGREIYTNNYDVLLNIRLNDNSDRFIYALV